VFCTSVVVGGGVRLVDVLFFFFFLGYGKRTVVCEPASRPRFRPRF